MFVYFFYAIWYFIQCWIALYLALPFIFLLIYLFKRAFGLRYSISDKAPTIKKDFDFAAIVTAHREIRLIPPLVDSLCKQSYSNFNVYVVADGCDVSSLNFDDPRIIILKPEQDLNSKIKSIDYALNHFTRMHDSLVIFDSDNLVHPDFMQVLNLYFKQGYRAVQTNLQPKNTDTLYSRLDSIGDIFYNFTEREMRMELGLSSAIWGLGIAIETRLYKEIIYNHFLGGFDKRIQSDIVQKIPQLAFAREALVYDEKIIDGKALQTQRTRWISTYLKYMSLSWGLFFKGLTKINFNIAYFGFINLRPPMFIVVILSFVFCIINFFINETLGYAWLGLIVVFICSFFSIVMINSNDKRITRSIFFMPLFILRQILALFKIKKADKSFLKTEHSKVIFIDELLKHEHI
jgi:cellulose synthase/poly-beta-1,6-N-acetylglucosamine synthase-like glycosyltransferase